jgi:hypothetical protein
MAEATLMVPTQDMVLLERGATAGSRVSGHVGLFATAAASMPCSQVLKWSK